MPATDRGEHLNSVASHAPGVYNDRIVQEDRDMAKTTEAQVRATEKWKKKNIVQVKINLHRVNDSDVLEKLGRESSKAGYLKELVRADIEGRVLKDNKKDQGE